MRCYGIRYLKGWIRFFLAYPLSHTQWAKLLFLSAYQYVMCQSGISVHLDSWSGMWDDGTTHEGHCLLWIPWSDLACKNLVCFVFFAYCQITWHGVLVSILFLPTTIPSLSCLWQCCPKVPTVSYMLFCLRYIISEWNVNAWARFHIIIAKFSHLVTFYT